MSHPPGEPGDPSMPTASEYDALADLFLSGDPGSPRPQPISAQAMPAHGPTPGDFDGTAARATAPKPGEARRDRVEVLVLGHLPVLGAAWVGQYARMLSDERAEAVALLRHGGGQVSLDLVSAGANPWHAAHRDPPASLADAVGACAALTRTWLVKADEVSEARLAEFPGITDITVLTSVDDAALVACYRALKFLARHAESREHEAARVSVAPVAQPAIRVAIMGAPADKALEAKAKLERTASAFLGLTIGVHVGSHRIGPASSIQVFRGTAEDPAGVVVHAVRALGEREARHDAPGTGQTLRLAASQVEAAPASRIGPTPVDRPRAAAKAPEPIHHGAEPGAPDPATGVHEARRTAEASIVRRTIDGGAALARHLPGLHALPATCPYAPHVQLATDAGGTVHLLVSVNPALASMPGAGDAAAADAVARLLAVAGWVRDHADLIRLACPGVSPGAGGTQPMLHLFTDQPRDVRRWLDSGLRIHLLTNAGGDAGAVWVCRDLN